MQPLYYRSNRTLREPAPKPKRHRLRRFMVFVLVVGVAGVALWSKLDVHHAAAADNHTTTTTTKPASNVATTNTAATPSVCAQNTLPTYVLVSISQQHMWACEGSKQVYDSAVVTGMENLPADLTPVGTYHIYAKQTDLYLNGSDSTGSWHDYVNYFMPWLRNQYGIYGFHDATWRSPSAFGNISPDSSDASHGCVELPLATAKWLYNWSVIGTTVQIES